MRVNALTSASERPASAPATIEVVEFLLARERYGIESSAVRQVYPVKELTPLPGTPPFVLGIVNVHGEIVSVIDLTTFFDLHGPGLTELSKAIILQSGHPPNQMTVGILADAILGVREIPVDELQRTLPAPAGVRADWLKGMTTEQVMILNVVTLLSDQRIVVNERVS